MGTISVDGTNLLHCGDRMITQKQKQIMEQEWL
jgi:hypothetical protein